MHSFVRNLLTEWRRLDLPFEGETLVVAVSGGADSVSLLAALNDLTRRKKITNRIVVAHFDHLLRPESGLDAEFVRSLSAEFGFDFDLGQAEGRFAIDTQGNLEQNARLARYRFLADVSERHSAAAILTAHTIDDQAETFLINLLRGSGSAGLTAMRPDSRAFSIESGVSPMRLVRPLLRWTDRSMTVGFCKDLEIGFRDDPMNSDRSYTRVRIRHDLMPVLRTFNPRIVETLARTAASLESDEPPVILEDQPRIREIAALGPATLRAALREWLGRMRGDLRGIGLKHIQATERLILSRKSGAKVELPGGATVIKGDGRLRFEQGNRIEPRGE